MSDSIAALVEDGWIDPGAEVIEVGERTAPVRSAMIRSTSPSPTLRMAESPKGITVRVGPSPVGPLRRVDLEFRAHHGAISRPFADHLVGKGALFVGLGLRTVFLQLLVDAGFQRRQSLFARGAQIVGGEQQGCTVPGTVARYGISQIGQSVRGLEPVVADLVTFLVHLRESQDRKQAKSNGGDQYDGKCANDFGADGKVFVFRCNGHGIPEVVERAQQCASRAGSRGALHRWNLKSV